MHRSTPFVATLASFLSSTVLALAGGEAAATATLPLRLNDSVVTSSDGVYVAGAHTPSCTGPPPGSSWAVPRDLVVPSSALREATDPPAFNDFVIPITFRPNDLQSGVQDIFVAASPYYGGLTQEVTTRIYRIDGATGSVGTFVALSGSSTTTAGIGGLAYNPTHDVLYATNQNDGRIYVVKPDVGGETGTVQGTYDPFAPWTSHSGDPVAPLGERMLGLGWNDSEGRLYVARWLSDWTSPAETEPNRIYSFPVDPDGIPLDDPTALDTRHFEELNVPEFPDYSNPVMSIRFDENDARMLLGTRPMGFATPGTITVTPGDGRVHEYVGGHDLWSDPSILPPLSPSGDAFDVGTNGTMGSGGAAYAKTGADSCNLIDRIVIAADELATAPSRNGLQLAPAGGGNLASSEAAIMDVGPLGVVDVCHGCAPHPSAGVPLLGPWARGLIVVCFVLLGSGLVRRARTGR